MTKPGWPRCLSSCGTCLTPLRKGCKGYKGFSRLSWSMALMIRNAARFAINTMSAGYAVNLAAGGNCWRARHWREAMHYGSCTRMPGCLRMRIVAMERALEQNAVGGYFRFRFDAPRAWPALLLEPAIALRCRIGVPYGDQGLFMTRRAYMDAGGHSPWPLFEEVALVRGLRRLGRFVPLHEPLFIDPRRWHRDGWWRRTWVNRNLAFAFARGAKPERLAARYRSKTTT